MPAFEHTYVGFSLSPRWFCSTDPSSVPFTLKNCVEEDRCCLEGKRCSRQMWNLILVSDVDRALCEVYFQLKQVMELSSFFLKKKMILKSNFCTVPSIKLSQANPCTPRANVWEIISWLHHQLQWCHCWRPRGPWNRSDVAFQVRLPFTIPRH